MKFRPCIDLKNGRVVQIVGSTLRNNSEQKLIKNYQSDLEAADYAKMYQKDNLSGGHIISLGSGNLDASLSALKAYPKGMQIGGGINPENAGFFLEAGASHVIVTSYVFYKGNINMDRLMKLVKSVGKKQLVLDLSCRKKDSDFWIVTDRWQTFSHVQVNKNTLIELADFCDEFLVHGVDVEGKRQGIQKDLVRILGEYSPIPVTYAGGVKSFSDLDKVKKLGQNRVDLTIGSALDIFGGNVLYAEVKNWHDQNQN